jgi:hypothetical protein
MNNSVLVVVHLGSLLSRNEDRNDELYGSYKDYLDKLRNAVRQQKSIVITNPSKDSAIKRLLKTGHLGIIPFKVPNKTEIIRDHDGLGFNYLGKESLISTLKTEKIVNVDVCGEQLWRYPYGDVRKSKELYLGCVVYYHNALCKAGISSKIRRDLCYPTKDPPTFRGSF